MVAIDQEIEVKILHIDREKEKIALGLKQKMRQPVGDDRRQVPGRHGAQGRGRQRDELRRVREARRGHRRPGPHQRNVVDQADQPSERAGAHRRRDRSRRAQHQQGQAGNLARHEADPGQPVGQGGRAVPARHDRQRHGPQPHQLRRVHRDRRGHRRPAARQRHVVDAQDQPSQRDGREGPEDRVQGALGRSGTPPHRPGPQADGRRSVGDRHSRQVPAGPDW